MKSTTNPPLGMTWINPISWRDKLLRLLHKTRETVHDDPIPHVPLVVPRIDFPAVDDDPPNEHADLPYEIILDILSRLPAECIFKCRCVSRPLQVLTTTPFFTHMQRQRSTPVIVVQVFSEESDCESTNLYYLDKDFERIEEKFTPVDTTDPRFLLSSYDGFLTFVSFIGLAVDFYMWNPITGEEITMGKNHMHVCGLFFNPVRNDHELLYYTIDKWAPSGPYYTFGAYSLRTKLRRDIGRFLYPPSRYRPPVIIKGTLYWMIYRSEVNRESCPPFSHSIMSFNIETEEFSTLEPGGRKYSAIGYFSDDMLRISRLHLSEMDGELCLCDFVGAGNELLLSTFNHATQCWSSRTIVILPTPLGFIRDWTNKFAAEVVQIKDYELLVRQGRRLLLYNMLSHTCKISEIMGCTDKGIRVTVHSDRIDAFYYYCDYCDNNHNNHS